jgi:hypothetical protein
MLNTAMFSLGCWLAVHGMAAEPKDKTNAICGGLIAVATIIIVAIS